MRKLKFIMIFSLVVNILYPENIDFSVITMGNLKGEYKSLSNIYTAVNKVKLLRKDIIKINTGNNLIGFKEIDDIYVSFFNDIKSDFNFYALGEYLADSANKYDFEFSTLNINEDNILDYKIVDKLDYKIAVIGLTDIYEYKNGINYLQKLEKVIFNVEEYVDFIFVVSDLNRAENVEILDKHPEVSLLFESGRYQLDEDKIKINNNYIVPTGTFKIIDVSYNPEENSMISKYNNKSSLKNMTIENIYNVENLEEYPANNMVGNYINQKEEAIIKRNNEIVGYNLKSFDKEEVLFSNDVIYIQQLGVRLIEEYGSDMAIIPALNFKKGLEKGLYTVEDIYNLFTSDKLMELTISQDKLDEINNLKEENRGTQDYLHIIKNRSDFTQKEKYSIITTETLAKNYNVEYDKIEKIDLIDFELNRR